jgi:RNA polymerase sigma factor (sigma-70 family)
VARFEQLWQELFPRVLGYALRRMDPEEARDVVAETFTVAWRRLEEMPPGELALPWLLTTARKQSANRRRAAETRARIGDGPLATPAISRDPAEGVATRSTLAEAFNRLGPVDRETLALIAWDGLQPREAATVAGCSAATFAVRAHRARRRLAALLHSEDGSPAVDAQGGRT